MENESQVELEDESQDLYSEARDFVRKEGSASVSGLQRGLKLGYSKAARLMDLLEEHLVIGEADGSKPRELLDESVEVPYEESMHDVIERTKRREWKVSHTRLSVNLPSIAGLAVYLGVNRDTVYAWRDKDLTASTEEEKSLFLEFSDILGDILTEQEKRLVNGGISGTYNPMITKLALGKHGYADKADITSGDKPIQASPEAQAMAAKAIDEYLNGSRDNPGT